MEFYQLVIIIIFFSAIQSIAGVGLLLFGTPTLLLFGYAYPEVLWILLPASCSLSLVQIAQGYWLIDSKRDVYCLTIPSLICALILIIKLDYIFDIKKTVGLFLCLIAVLRLSSFPKNWARLLLDKYRRISYVLIGVVHGLSNLGGAPLSVIVSASYSDRLKVNANIAFVYFILALSQLVVLFIYELKIFTPLYLVFIPIVIFNHLILGKTLTLKLDDANFKKFINLIVLVFGILCLF